MRYEVIKNVIGLSIGLIFALVVCAMSGCAHPKVVVAPEVHTETKTDSSVVADKVQKWDSVYVSHVERIVHDTLLVKDTLIKFKTIDVVREVEKVVTREVKVEKPYPVDVVKEVRVRSEYDKFMARGFWLLLLLGVLLIAGRVILWYVRQRR